MRAALAAGVPALALSTGLGSTTDAGCGCFEGGMQCCPSGRCCGPSQTVWDHAASNSCPYTSPELSCGRSSDSSCNVLGTDLPCHNWAESRLRDYVQWVGDQGIGEVGVFMSTIDQVKNQSTEGRNATSAFWYDVLAGFLRGG